jgi:protein-S-isoprenylcysteine O-methyltransferase Ste14
VIGARPTALTIVIGGALILAGETLRLWAASFIGPHSRGTTLRAPRLVTEGPYALMRHPLYAGNGLVCAGLLVFSGAFLPWLPLVFIPAFLVQYALFMAREERFLAAEWGREWKEYRAGASLRSISTSPRTRNRAEFRITQDGWRLEWPTLRTILGLMLLCLVSGLWKEAR